MRKKAKPETKPLTKKEFERTLEKVFTTPIPRKQESDSAEKETLESHPRDGSI